MKRLISLLFLVTLMLSTFAQEEPTIYTTTSAATKEYKDGEWEEWSDWGTSNGTIIKLHNAVFTIFATGKTTLKVTKIYDIQTSEDESFQYFNADAIDVLSEDEVLIQYRWFPDKEFKHLYIYYSTFAIVYYINE